MARSLSRGFTGMSWQLLAIASLMAFAIWVPMFSVPPMETAIANELSLSHTQTSLLYSLAILMMAVTAIPAGLVADKIGIKRAAGIGGIIVIIGNVFRGISADYTTLLIFTLVYGIGLGWSFPNLPKLVAHCAPREKVFPTWGVLSAAVIISGGFSLAMTVPLIYPLTNSYRGVFLIWSIPAVLATILWWLFVKDPPCAEESTALNDWRNLEKVLRNPALWLIAGILFMHNYFLYTWGGWLSLFLNGEGASPSLAAIITSITFWIGAPVVILVTGFSLQGERKLLIWASSIIIGFCVIWAFFVNIPTSWLLVTIAGIASTTRFTTILTLPVEIMPKEQSGTASGLVIAIGYLGALIGPVISGYILDVTNSFNLVFYILIGISAATATAGFMLKKEQRIN